MLVDLTPTWPIVIPQPPEARPWCRRPLVVEVLVIAGIMGILAAFGLLLWPLVGSVAEPWRVVAVQVILAVMLIALAGRILVPRHSTIILAEDGILRRDHYSTFSVVTWCEDTWLTAWDDVLSYQMRSEPAASGGRPDRRASSADGMRLARVTFKVLGRYGSRPLEVLCNGSGSALEKLHEVLQGKVAREDAGLLEAYRAKRPARARRWDGLLVAACVGVALFPDLALQTGLTAFGIPEIVRAPPLEALPLWRYVLGGLVIVLGVALTTRVQHAVGPPLAIGAFFFAIPAALIPVDEPTASGFFRGELSAGATFGVAFVVLLKLAVVAAITGTWREYVTRGVHDGSARKPPVTKRRPPPIAGSPAGPPG